MSDTPQGPDWWQASDDKWYPPPRPEMPGDPVQTAVAAPGMPPPDAPPMAGPPMGPPTGPPSGGFPPGPPSPYAGMPPVAPAAGQQNKTPLFVAIGVVVTIALVALIVMLTGDDDTASPDDPPTTDPRVPTTPTDDTIDEPDDPPSGNATVEVVDSGFSNFMGGFDQDERSASYGFIIENTGDTLATDIQVSVSAYDAAGTAVASASHTVYVLRPGEQMGIGDEFFGTTLTTDIDSVDVQVGEPSDFGIDDVPAEGALTAEGITTRADDYNLTTTFTAKSTYAQQIDSPSAYAIYRDADGNIVGGSVGWLDFLPANGSTAGEVRSYDVIPNVATTEIYLDPGWFA